MSHGSGLILLKILKEGTPKVWLGSYFVQKAKTRYGLGFLPLKMLKQGTARFYPIEYAKLRYGWSVDLFKVLK